MAADSPPPGAFFMPVSELYTLSEIATRYRVSRWLLQRAVRDGRLPALRVGTLIRVTADDLDAFVRRPSCPMP
jgi:excisionase family DNA binding protein